MSGTGFRIEGLPFDPATEPYVSLATRRRDGREVRTPVWVVDVDGAACVFSAGAAGKVKRLRRDPRGHMAACSFRGVVHGEWVSVRARWIKDPALLARVHQAFAAKYGWQFALTNLFSRVSGRYSRRVVLAFDPD